MITHFPLQRELSLGQLPSRHPGNSLCLALACWIICFLDPISPSSLGLLPHFGEMYPLAAAWGKSPWICLRLCMSETNFIWFSHLIYGLPGYDSQNFFSLSIFRPNTASNIVMRNLMSFFLYNFFFPSGSF